jgi:predicted site-specific integrase-resolvase
MTAKTRPDFIPPWMDQATLCAHICIGGTTVDTWVAQGILPPPRKRGGKLMWKWEEVDDYLTHGTEARSPDAQADRIRNASRRIQEGGADYRG